MAPNVAALIRLMLVTDDVLRIRAGFDDDCRVQALDVDLVRVELARALDRDPFAHRHRQGALDRSHSPVQGQLADGRVVVVLELVE